jgi:RimJ/RimL family protein N-acetyltransferase
MTTTETLTYEFRVDGHLDDHWSAWLDGLTLARQDDGTTTLAGPMADQAQLHGLLARLRDMGATLRSLRALGDRLPSDGVAMNAVPMNEGSINGISMSDAGPPPRNPLLDRTLQTERLTLRAATADDVEATFAYRRLEPVARWLTQLPADLETYRATFTEPGRLANAVIVQLDGRVIGDFMLKVENAWAQAEVADQARGRQAELGWVLDPAFTGHGYATEAARGLLRVCFEDLGIRRVVAGCFVDNDASWRLMERIGMRRESHTVRDGLHRSGRWLDGFTYAVLAEEWAAAT